MRKLLTLLLAATMITGMTLAYGPDNNPGDNPDVDTPVEIDERATPDQGVSGAVEALPLPSQASDTAKTVVNTIVDTPTQAIGDTLSGLLNGDNDTETE